MYRHTQRAMLIVAVVLGVGILPVAALLVVAGEPIDAAGRLVLAFSLALLVGAIWLFSSLTITVDVDRLAWSFGPGLVRKSVPLDEIVHAERTRTRWIEGWGIHYTTRGWLYNVSGFDAVHVRLAGRKQFLLGTDDPDGLLTAIEAARRAPVTG